MQIAVDVRPALKRGTGVGTFIENLVLALGRRGGNDEYHLFSSSLKDRLPDEPWRQISNSRVHDKRIPVRLLNYFWHRFGWPPVDWFTGAVDVTVSPSPLMVPGRGKRIVTLHDLYFLQRPDDTVAEIRSDYVKLVHEHTRRADAVLSVSEATRDTAVELLALPPERITVIGEDISPVFDASPKTEELDEVDMLFAAPFFLFVGTVEPRKNLTALLEAFSSLAESEQETRLVIAGTRGWKTAEFDRALETLPNMDRVTITGYCPRKMLRALYHRAVALIMPSHCEGFGLPLLEAMACQCPVITRRISAMPEVAGEAALYWDGERISALAELMLTLLKDTETRSNLISLGREQRQKFSWDETARRVEKVFQQLA